MGGKRENPIHGLDHWTTIARTGIDTSALDYKPVLERDG
jgi:hypothetical protein